MPKTFDRLVRPYRTLEHLLVGRQLEHARFAHLSALRRCRRILVLGEGDGRFTAHLLQHAPGAEIHVVERSPAMLAAARARCSANSPVHWHCADAVRFTPDGHFDAIVTICFLDCLLDTTARTLIARLVGRSLARGGKWLYVDFQVPSAGFARLRAVVVIWLLYRFFRLTTDISSGRYSDPRPHLHRSGLHPVAWQTFSNGMLTSELWQRSGEPLDRSQPMPKR